MMSGIFISITVKLYVLPANYKHQLFSQLLGDKCREKEKLQYACLTMMRTIRAFCLS